MCVLFKWAVQVLAVSEVFECAGGVTRGLRRSLHPFGLWTDCVRCLFSFKFVVVLRCFVLFCLSKVHLENNDLMSTSILKVEGQSIS